MSDDYKKRLTGILEGTELSEDQKAKLEEIFPELKESEDERISKILIRVIKELAKGYDRIAADLSLQDAVAWLRKKEKKNTTFKYVYPKFRIGDTVRPKDGNDCHTITSITSDRFYKDDTGWCLDILAQDNCELVKPGQDAWSEVDEKNLEETIWYVENGGKLVFEKTDKLVSWLKSIKPQSHWRPSDEQMEALWNSIPENVMEFSEREQLLDNLYQDLKKLL